MYILQSIKLRHRTGNVYSLSQNLSTVCIYTVKPVLRGHIWDKEKVAKRWPLKIYSQTCIKRSPL